MNVSYTQTTDIHLNTIRQRNTSEVHPLVADKWGQDKLRTMPPSLKCILNRAGQIHVNTNNLKTSCLKFDVLLDFNGNSSLSIHQHSYQEAWSDDRQRLRPPPFPSEAPLSWAKMATDPDDIYIYIYIYMYYIYIYMYHNIFPVARGGRRAPLSSRYM